MLTWVDWIDVDGKLLLVVVVDGVVDMCTAGCLQAEFDVRGGGLVAEGLGSDFGWTE